MTRRLKLILSIGASVVFLGFLIYLWSEILTPFFIAALIAYLGNPLVNKMVQWKISRTWAVVIVFTFLFLVFILLLLLLVPMVEHQLRVLVLMMPKLFAWLKQDVIPFLSNRFGIHNIDINQIQSMVMANWKSAGSVAATIVKAISHSGGVIANWVANILLVPVVAFYLMRDWHLVVDGVNALLPRAIEPLISHLSRECNEVLGAFFRGQLLVMIALGLIYSIGLSIVGLQLALLIGLMAGLLSVVPYLGFFVGIGAATIAAILQFHGFSHMLYVFIVFGIGQAMEGMVLTPMLVGDKIGLHSVAVIFAIMAGGEMFGFVGILLALPVAAVIMVLLRYLHQQYLESEVYKLQRTGKK